MKQSPSTESPKVSSRENEDAFFIQITPQCVYALATTRHFHAEPRTFLDGVAMATPKDLSP